MFALRKTTELLQFALAATVLATLAILAGVGMWPFDAPGVSRGDASSLAEAALGDRLTIGLIRTAVLSVVAYVVVSVPALVIDRRWIQGLTTTGLTADSGRGAEGLDELRAEVAEIRRFFVMQGDQPDVVSDLVDFFRGQDADPEVTDDDG